MTRDLSKRRVLICDDTAENYDKLREYLETEGFQCDDRVENEAAVREALRRSHEDKQFYFIVFLDLDLSGAGELLSGAQVYYSLQQDYPNETYVIYTTRDVERYRSIINQLMYRDVTLVLLEGVLSLQNIQFQLAQIVHRSDPRSIFVVHGRNHTKLRKLNRLLVDGFGLEVLSWEDAREQVLGRDYIYEVVLKGIEMSHLTVVLFTDDEEVELRSALRLASDFERIRGDSTKKRRQSRANVYIEAGYALGIRPKRTIFVEWQSSGAEYESPSNFSGIHVLKFQDSEDGRARLRQRLEAARCELSLSPEWQTMPL